MNRKERTLRRANRIEMHAYRATVRATSNTNPLSYAAISAGVRASRAFARANAMRRAVLEQEAARKREIAAKAKRKREAIAEEILGTLPKVRKAGAA